VTVRLTLLVAIASALFVSCAEEMRSRSAERPPVVLISIDTLRADRLPAYGYRDVATPNIDALRSDSVLFTNAYAHVPLTLPSHVSLFTGLLPPAHGVRNNIGYTLEGSKHPTLARVLKDNGYATGGAVSAFVLRGTTGIAGGFDLYDDAITARGGGAAGSVARSGAQTLEAVKPWLAARGSEPFFLFLHLFEPHSPYDPPEPFRSQYRDPYDGEIAAADSIVGRLIDDLKARGVYDRAVVILLSDHGEGLGDHGEAEHGIFLYREAIRVPLMIKLPKSERGGQTVDAPVGLADIAPTIISIAGLQSSARFDGRSLFEKHEVKPVYSESYYGHIHLGWSELRSLAGERFHFIEAPRPELYDVVADPAEKNNVLESERRAYARLRDELSKVKSDLAAPAAVGSEEAAKLAALGYLGSTRAASSGPRPDPKDRIHELEVMLAAKRMADEGRTAEAEAALRKLLDASPLFTDARIHLAQLYDAGGRLEDAEREYRRVLRDAPELAGEVGGSLGAVLLKLRRFDEAQSHARLAERTNPPGMHLLLTRIAIARGDLATAEREANAAAQFPSARQDAELVVAQVLAARGALDQALRTVNKLVDEIEAAGGPQLAGLHFVLGDVLARMNRPGEAMEAFRREIAHFPNNRDAYARLALVKMLTGDRAGARETLELLVRRSPTKQNHLFAAQTLEELDDPEGARIWRRRADALR
jgi:arylsulfatase A-like enzyme/Tfp pilus assembly protein PilF